MPKTYNELYITLRKKLKELGVDACSLEARLLVAYAADKTPEKLLQDLQLYTSPAIEARVAELSRRRLAGEPVAYITGSWEFYGLNLTVTPEVLVPRADTEVLVEKALALTEDRNAPLRVLDLCTGSGCIGCALGAALPRSRVTLADLSRSALNVAKLNVRGCGLTGRALCVEADALSEPAPQLGLFDLIVSNPPYIDTAEIETLDSSVRDYEPRMALDGGADGLDFYRSITEKWSSMLRPGGWLLFEIGETQAAAVTALMKSAGLAEVGTVQDTAGLDRVVYGRAKSGEDE